MNRHTLSLLAILSTATAASAGAAPMTLRPVQMASVTCFSKGEQVSGMNKICFYDCMGSGSAITVRATQLCPLTINE